MSKKERLLLARARKGRLKLAGRSFVDLANTAAVSYSLAEKWMNARRNSEKCERAFERLIACS